jgi:hypothetical protein
MVVAAAPHCKEGRPWWIQWSAHRLHRWKAYAVRVGLRESDALSGWGQEEDSMGEPGRWSGADAGDGARDAAGGGACEGLEIGGGIHGRATGAHAAEKDLATHKELP